nr:MAG TPA: hypothetical protein [Caudoviricetes sp.]DAT21045.1 MAG TPA: hypothetical protein [Caudoviricetes sp.]DAV27917.1 MAG TPA: hypothetical protein [Caudoviricetes sp.]
MGAGKGNRSQLPSFSRRLALFLSIKPARHSGFYTIYRRDELRTRERKIEQWHLHVNF